MTTLANISARLEAGRLERAVAIVSWSGNCHHATLADGRVATFTGPGTTKTDIVKWCLFNGAKGVRFADTVRNDWR